MTARQVYEGTLIELNKIQAPSMLLEDFNYFINKAVNQYINKKYNIYDINQQSTDDLRVLKATAIIPVTAITNAYGQNSAGQVTARNSLYAGTYEADLPTDYLHLLNCVCNYKVLKQFKCYDRDTYVQFGATRLTADLWSQIINNFYMKPSYKRPYYYLHHVNSTNGQPNNEIPTNPLQTGTSLGPLGKGTDVSAATNLPRSISLSGGTTTVNMVEKEAGVRFGNQSQVRIEVRTGKDSSIFQLEDLYIDYIKARQHISLTQEQIDLTEDTSQMMEFPDYVCQEIINELTHLIMENSSDPRLQSHMPITMSIANPAAQQQQPQQQTSNQ